MDQAEVYVFVGTGYTGTGKRLPLMRKCQTGVDESSDEMEHSASPAPSGHIHKVAL